jgi:RNA binding exosome subunit
MGKRKDEETDETEDKSLLGEALKKVVSVGVSAAFMTEENIRGYLGDLKLPKDVLNTLIQTAGKSKDEITRRVGNEIIGIVSKIDWVKEFAKFAESHKFKISAEIDIVRKDKDSSKD